MFDGKHLAGAPEPGLHFVGDEKNAVLIEDFFHLFEIVERWHDDSALAHDGLGDKRGDITRGRETNRVLQRFGALPAALLGILWPERTISVGSRSKCDARRVGAAALFAALITGDAERTPAASVKPSVQRDEFVLAGEKAGELERAFVRFGAAIAEESLRLAVRRVERSVLSRNDVRDFLSQVGDGLHVIEIRGAVDQLVHLRFRRRDDLGVAMARVDDGDARAAVKI